MINRENIYQVDKDLNIIPEESGLNIIYNNKKTIFIENDELNELDDLTGIELLTKELDFFKDIVLNSEDISNMVDIANKTANKIKEIEGELLNNKVDNNIDDLDIEINNQELINMYNPKSNKIDSFLKVDINIEGEDFNLKYKFKDSILGELELDSENSVQQNNKIFNKIGIDNNKNNQDKITAIIQDELSIYCEEMVDNKFEDELGLANTELANRMFLNRNKIVVDNMEVKKNGKLLSTIEFDGKDVEYHPNKKATFEFKVSKDGDIDLNDNALMTRTDKNKQVMEDFMKVNLPYPVNKQSTEELNCIGLIGVKVNNRTKHFFDENKQDLLLSAKKENKKKKELNFSL